MIARTWQARSETAKAELYVRHFTDIVGPGLRALAGHRGAWLLRREAGGGTEFMAVTLWESRASIKAFAGDDIAKSHVEPAGQACLSSFDDFAHHYEVAFTAP